MQYILIHDLLICIWMTKMFPLLLVNDFWNVFFFNTFSLEIVISVFLKHAMLILDNNSKKIGYQ